MTTDGALDAGPLAVREDVLTTLDTRYALRQPLPIRIETWSADEVFVVCPALDAYGGGDTLDEALANLRLDLVALYEALRDYPDPALGPLPLRWKRRLVRDVREVLSEETHGE